MNFLDYSRAETDEMSTLGPQISPAFSSRPRLNVVKKHDIIDTLASPFAYQGYTLRPLALCSVLGILGYAAAATLALFPLFMGNIQ